MGSNLTAPSRWDGLGPRGVPSDWDGVHGVVHRVLAIPHHGLDVPRFAANRLQIGTWLGRRGVRRKHVNLPRTPKGEFDITRIMGRGQRWLFSDAFQQAVNTPRGVRSLGRTKVPSDLIGTASESSGGDAGDNPRAQPARALGTTSPAGTHGMHPANMASTTESPKNSWRAVEHTQSADPMIDS